MIVKQGVYAMDVMRSLRGAIDVLENNYILEIDDTLAEGNVVNEVDVKGEELIEEDENPFISIHAINGSVSKGFRTMRITGKIGKKDVHILIDSSSTHNFLDIHLARRLGLSLTQVKPVMVDVADGNRLECDSMCKGLKWTLRHTTFITDVLLLPLGNCDIVLGIQWLETLGIIHWDFKHLIMEFKLQGRKHVPKDKNIHNVSEKEMNNIISHCPDIQLCCIRVMEANSMEPTALVAHNSEEVIPGGIQLFLETQESVFAEPTTLPPMRSHNHKIVLTNGASPVNSRPYRHTALQKNIIEKMVFDLLTQGFIQPSTSPFSSPVVLVKKNDGSWRM